MAKQRKPAVRLHNEWFRSLSAKKCPTCKAKSQVYSWGEYQIGKWRTVKHFCQECFSDEVLKPLLEHKDECGCSIVLVHAPGFLQEAFTCKPKEIVSSGN